MRVPRYVPALLFVAVAGIAVAWMVLEARGFNEAARTTPLVVGIPTIVFIAAQLVRDGRRVARGDQDVGTASDYEQDRYMQAAASQVDVTATLAQQDEAPEDRSTSLPLAIAWVAGLALLIWLVGMLAAIPVFMATFMRVFGRERWITIAAYAAGTTAAVYLFFAVGLEVNLYEGLFGDALPWP
jgi:hypothetical protein